MSHQCPIEGCSWSIPDDKLMCLSHWRLVPETLAKRITHYYRVLTARRSAIELRLKANKIYREARDQAIRHVNQAGPLR